MPQYLINIKSPVDTTNDLRLILLRLLYAYILQISRFSLGGLLYQNSHTHAHRWGHSCAGNTCPMLSVASSSEQADPSYTPTGHR